MAVEIRRRGVTHGIVHYQWAIALSPTATSLLDAVLASYRSGARVAVDRSALFCSISISLAFPHESLSSITTLDHNFYFALVVILKSSSPM